MERKTITAVWKIVDLLLGTIVCLILWCTPRRISQMTWRVTITRAYAVSGLPGWRVVRYNHEHNDGMRILHRLSTKALPSTIILQNPPPQCELWATVTLTGTDSVSASPFVRLISILVAHSTFMKTQNHVDFGVVVSTRHRLKVCRYRRGCFVRYANVSATCDDTLQSVADRASEQMQLLRTRGRLWDTVAQRSRAMLSHYLFNKWPLYRIERSDGRVLQVYKGGHEVSVDYILNIQQPLEIKCVQETKTRFTLLVNPIYATFK